MLMTPLQYARKYKELDVYLYTDEQAKKTIGTQLPQGGEWRTINVHGYRLGLKTAYQTTTHSINIFKEKVRPHINEKDESITVWVKTINGNVVSKTYHSRKEIAENINDPFYGKGSPEEVQVVLQLAVRYGVFPKEKIQIYCDNNNIGLDCNGFVGNYLRHVWQNKPWDSDARTREQQKTEFDANTMIKSIMSFSTFTQPVKTIQEIEQQPFSIYLFAISNEHGHILDHIKYDDGTIGYGHIMITEPNTLKKEQNPVLLGSTKLNEALAITVVESTGGDGLVDSTYYFLNVNKHGVFTVYRGIKHHQILVTIARLL